MGRWNWERLAPLSGLVFIVLLIVSIAIPDQPPDLDSVAAKFDAYVLDNARELKIGAILSGLAAFALIWFLGCLAARIREAGEQRLAATAFGAGMVVIAMYGVSSAIMAGLAFETASGPPAAAKDLFTIAIVAQVISSLPGSVIPAATAVASWRSKAFPQWYGALTGLLAVVGVFGGAALATDGFYSPTGGYSWIANIAFFVWVVLTSGLLWQQAAGEKAPRAAQAA